MPRSLGISIIFLGLLLLISMNNIDARARPPKRTPVHNHICISESSAYLILAIQSGQMPNLYNLKLMQYMQNEYLQISSLIVKKDLAHYKISDDIKHVEENLSEPLSETESLGGYAHLESKTIFLERYECGFSLNVLLHEIAHVLNGYGHPISFKLRCNILLNKWIPKYYAFMDLNSSYGKSIMDNFEKDVCYTDEENE